MVVTSLHRFILEVLRRPPCTLDVAKNVPVLSYSDMNPVAEHQLQVFQVVSLSLVVVGEVRRVTSRRSHGTSPLMAVSVHAAGTHDLVQSNKTLAWTDATSMG